MSRFESSHYKELNQVTSELADMTKNVKTQFNAKGDGTTIDTLALQNAAQSGVEVLIPEGTYVINDSITLSPFTRFVATGTVIFKVTTDITVLKLTYKNKIVGIDFDVSSVVPYTQDILEISSKTMQGASTWDYKVDIWLEKLSLTLNNPSMPAQGTFFHIWAAQTDPNNNTDYTNIGFWGITVKDIDIKGYLGFFCRNYAYQTDGTSTTGWLTGVHFENCNMDSVRYGFYGCDTVANMGNLNYVDCGNLVIDNVQMQCNGSQYFAYFTNLNKIIKNSIPWDWQKSDGTPTPFLVQYKSDTDYMNMKIFIDYGYGHLSDVFSVYGAPNYMSSSELNNWLRYTIAKYTDVFNEQINSLMNIKPLSISGSQSMPSYIKVVDFTTNVSQFTAGFMANMSYYKGNFGVVSFTFTVADSAPTIQSTNPILSIVTTPYVPIDQSFSYYVSKTVQSDGNTTYKIYLKLTTNTLGAGFYWVPFSIREQYDAPVNLELLSSAPSETLITGVLNNVEALPTLGASPSAHAGYMYYDTGANNPKWSDGTSWNRIPNIDSGASTTNATAGTVQTIPFNKTFRGTPQVICQPRSTQSGITISSSYITSTNFQVVCSSPSVSFDWIAIE